MSAIDELIEPLLAAVPSEQWVEQSAAVARVPFPQLAMFWAVATGKVERRRRWFGLGWKLRRVRR